MRELCDHGREFYSSCKECEQQAEAEITTLRTQLAAANKMAEELAVANSTLTATLVDSMNAATDMQVRITSLEADKARLDWLDNVWSRDVVRKSANESWRQMIDRERADTCAEGK